MPTGSTAQMVTIRTAAHRRRGVIAAWASRTLRPFFASMRRCWPRYSPPATPVGRRLPSWTAPCWPPGLPPCMRRLPTVWPGRADSPVHGRGVRRRRWGRGDTGDRAGLGPAGGLPRSSPVCATDRGRGAAAVGCAGGPGRRTRRPELSRPARHTRTSPGCACPSRSGGGRTLLRYGPERRASTGELSSGEHNWLTGKVLLTAVRAHAVGSMTQRTGQGALSRCISAGRQRVRWAREELNLRPLPCQAMRAPSRGPSPPYMAPRHPCLGALQNRLPQCDERPRMGSLLTNC